MYKKCTKKMYINVRRYAEGTLGKTLENQRNPVENNEIDRISS